MDINLELIQLIKKASSKDYTYGMNDQYNPEVINVDGEQIPSGVWRTNLLIEGELQRHEKTLLLCRLTSIEDNFHNNSFFSQTD